MIIDDNAFFFFAVAFIALLNSMITAAIWLSYLSSKKSYLAITCIAAALEVSRQFADYFSGIYTNEQWLYLLANALQFGSTLLLALALLSALRLRGRRDKVLISLLCGYFCVTAVYDTYIYTAASVAENYIVSIPLLIASSLLFWRALFTGRILTPSKVFFLVASGSLLAIRLTLPALTVSNLYLLMYYIEYINFSMMLTAMILYEIEYSNRKVNSLLDIKAQSEQDLQFIVDNSLDIILVTDEVGLLRSWSRQAQEVFGYSKSQAIGKIHIDDLFSNNFWKREHGTVDEFHERMESIEGRSFMVDVRLKEVTQNQTKYSIFVLRLIAEPGLAQH